MNARPTARLGFKHPPGGNRGDSGLLPRALGSVDLLSDLLFASLLGAPNVPHVEGLGALLPLLHVVYAGVELPAAARSFEIDPTYQVMKLLQVAGVIDMQGAQVMRWSPEDKQAPDGLPAE